MVAPMKTPRPPDQVLRRVLKTSRINGWSVVIFAVLSFLLSLSTGGALGLGMGLFIIVGGVMEIVGHRRLRRRDPDGMKLLVNSQLVVLGAVWLWALPSLLSFDAGYLQQQVIPNMREMLGAWGISLDSLLGQTGLSTNQIVPLVHLFFVILYGSVMLATLIYQGGMVFYYRRRTAAVIEALRAPPPIPPAAMPAAPAPDFSAAEQAYYDRVAAEMARQDLQPGLWARALAEAGANDARAQAFYIRMRVAQLRQEQTVRPG
jgi:hypothetical protein